MTGILNILLGAGQAPGPSGALVLSGPSSGTTGSPSANFTVTATALSGSDTVTQHTSGAGTFTPSSLSFSSGSSFQTFTYTASGNTTANISITDTLGATITGSPIAYTSTTSTPSGTYSGTITAGGDGTNTGYISGSFGSISPTTDSNGNTIPQLYAYPGAPGPPFLYLQINGVTNQSYFTNLTVPGVGTVTSAAASFTVSGGDGQWQWGGYMIVSSGSWSYS